MEPPQIATALAALLGHTRSAVLVTIAQQPGCSNTQLAAMVGVTKASASEHATTLRRAGLIHTVRDRNRALHSPTHVGLDLLNTAYMRP
ncbi:hypothetical protein STRAU_1599 [Streptomyces aurantiacus JA 4570]|uniref:HTH arsR-type domain-containing protein n=2 Tax=Streptomyces aurantiacus TaxID=47760 RepID=S3ZR90_9ACTN|nr:hypothetical protein STRAU_1599 [Streptomyces aurantiacus JA 4570]